MYLLDGQAFTLTGAHLQGALGRAYATHQRPYCACTEPPAPMYIARAESAFVVKRMPTTGHLHAVRCPHHADAMDNKRQEPAQSAIFRDPVTGRVQISAAFAMSSDNERISSRGGSEKSACKARQRFTLRDLVLYLWAEADLSSWRAAFAGKRNWAVVRHRLLRAASNVWVNGVPLEKALFLPEPFIVDRADQIRARRLERFTAIFSQHTARKRRMLLIGEVKELTSSRPYPRVAIKHLPDTVFHLPPMRANWQSGLQVQPPVGRPLHQLMAATFSVHDAIGLVIEHFEIVALSAEWLPSWP
jgi:hypothetical protein